MRNYDLALEKYWVTQSGYFRLETKMALGMGFIDGELLYCHGVSEGNVDKKLSTLKNNNRKVYDCLNNPFTDEFGIPPFIIDPTRINEPAIHQICYQMPSLLPLEIILVL